MTALFRKAMSIVESYPNLGFDDFTSTIVSSPDLAEKEKSYVIAAKYVRTFIKVHPPTRENLKRYRVVKKSLYRSYLDRCTSNRLPPPIVSTQFGKIFKNYYPDVQEGRYNISKFNQEYCYALVELLTEEPTEAQMFQMNHSIQGPPNLMSFPNIHVANENSFPVDFLSMFWPSVPEMPRLEGNRPRSNYPSRAQPNMSGGWLP